MWNYYLEENEKGIVITVFVPGYGKEDLFVKLDGKTLKIDSEDKAIKYEFSLSDKVDVDNATCDKGVLKVFLNKKQNKVKSITIN